ncbi:MAG: hypothetical protein MZV63_48345 [Marinilabiliales bacterium]|nr:hypothetical protein [Marinilabiliales bacterium]
MLYDEAIKATREYFGGDDLAAKVWASKYALKDSFGNLYEKTPDDMHRRLASEIYRIEQKYPNPLPAEIIYKAFKDFKYIIPQGGPMTGIGNDYQIASLSNCFVIGNKGDSDSYGGIMKIDQEQVQLMKRRGGVGHDLSHIRPKGTPVLNSALTSTGVVPFMERYSNSTREVAQDGRRGALMLSISIKHPDAESFIDAKAGSRESHRCKCLGKDHRRVHEGRGQRQELPPAISRLNRKIRNSSKRLMHASSGTRSSIMPGNQPSRASSSGIPSSARVVPDCYADLGYETVSTNPCGEIPLCPYDSCRLIAINLYGYVKNPFTQKAAFDFELFKEHVHLCTAHHG